MEEFPLREAFGIARESLISIWNWSIESYDDSLLRMYLGIIQSPCSSPKLQFPKVRSPLIRDVWTGAPSTRRVSSKSSVNLELSPQNSWPRSSSRCQESISIGITLSIVIRVELLGVASQNLDRSYA